MSDPAVPDGLTHVHSGKVRDLYRTEDGRLVVVASDRISAFDFVLDTPIPDKGRILTAMTAWWFERLADTVPNHLLALEDPLLPPAWRGRAMICRALEMVPVEAVARGYLAGSGLLEYRSSRTVCGVPLPEGLVDGSQLPEPIFTPATKAAVGEHDENVSYEQVAATVGEAVAAELRELTLTVYRHAAQIAAERGILLADTKFEFGHDPATGALVLGDEVLTPDSSRFWPIDGWQPGRAQPSFDKQYVRDWLTSAAADWDRTGQVPPPPLPPEVVAATRARYVEAYERLTGLSFADWPGGAADDDGPAAADRYAPAELSPAGGAVTRVLVDVVLKPEILDPQGQAIVGALGRLGIEGVRDVRQGKHFELEVEDAVDDATLTRLADTLLANPVIETFTIHRG